MKAIRNAERTQKPPKPGYPDRTPPAIEEPPPERLPDEAPVPNPDENREPPRQAAAWKIPSVSRGSGQTRWLGALALAGVLVLAAHSPVMAQESNDAAALGNDPCQTESGESGEGASSTDDATLSERLDHCNGVLEPPKVGDDMVENPPEKGKTPVIDPENLPRNKAEPE